MTNTVALFYLLKVFYLLMFKPLLACLPVLLSTAHLLPVAVALPPSAPEHVTAEIEQFIESFTVKIGSGQTISSGTLLGKQGNTYLVLTNRYLIPRNTSFSIRTFDGQTHSGEIIKDAFSKDFGLALLTFESRINYRLPSIADFTPRAGQALIIGGYRSSSGEFQSSRAALEQVLPANPVHRQIDQLVYGGTIRKGMSGGPLIEASGQLIGINSHGHPPASQNLSRVNGSTLTSEELEQLRQLNWGIPIDTVLAQLKPELLLSYQLPSPNTQLKLAKPNWTGWLKDLENRAKQFTVRVDNQTTGGNGSGVIVAKEGNTYTVLTAEHVLDQKGENHQFSVLTHDGESHVINANNIRLQPGVDLASFQFESEVNYPVATLANYPRTESDVVFVAGFPKVGKESPQWLMSGGIIYEEEQGRFSISNASITSQQQGTDLSSLIGPQASFAQGYDMVYTSITYRGMSGGPVLDSEGRVVGIHGQAESEPEEGSDQDVIQLGHSLGIPTGTAVALADRLGLKERQLQLETNKSDMTDLQQADWEQSLLTVEIPSGNAPSKIWIQRGDALRRLGRLEEALKAFNRAIEVSHDNSEYLHLALFGKAEILRKKEDFQNAVVSLEAAISYQPSYTSAWGRLAINYRELQEYEAALMAIERATQQQPESANLHNEKWNVLSRLERHQDALASINQALELSGRKAFFLNRGITFKNMEEYSKSIDDYNKVLELNPNSATAYNNRGITFKNMEEYSKSIDDYNKALELNPNNAATHFNRGITFASLQDYPKSIRDYSKAIEIDPNYADAYAYRGMSNNLLGNAIQAKKDWQLAADLYFDQKSMKKYKLLAYIILFFGFF